jgi:anaerobic magnesium-protoporphyrin IX monomethyl ester cyclase
MKVLLLNPPYLPGFIRSSRWAAVSISGSQWYPIWLAYCSGLLEKNGHEAKLMDALVDGILIDDVLKEVEHFSPAITVIYTSTPSLDNDIEIGEKIKQLVNCQIVLVGPWCSINPQEILKKSNKIDFLVRGEFDYPTLHLAQGMSPKDILSLFWKNSQGEVIQNPDQPAVTSEQLNEFPFVTDIYRRNLNIRNYKQAPQLYPFVDLFTGRGCDWGNCTFCLWPSTIQRGAPYRTRNIDNVIDEFRFVKEKLPFVKEIFIQDDTLPKKRAREISSAIIQEGLDMTWSSYCRADMDFETLKMMKVSGCRCLHVGYESGNLQLLKNMRKGVTPEIMERFTKDAKAAGLQIHADFIFGLPGETKKTIRETINWAKKLNVDSYQFATPKVYPTTPLHDWLQKNGCLSQEGQINYPDLSYDELCLWTKRAMRECYFSFKYFKSIIKKPDELKRLIRSARYVIPQIMK